MLINNLKNINEDIKINLIFMNKIYKIYNDINYNYFHLKKQFFLISNN